MIIMGYQGVGKTTLARRGERYLELESSQTIINGEHPKNWQIIYCNLAESLSQQGYIVLISAHGVVCQQLLKTAEDVRICYPAPHLKDAWIKRLQDRYDRTGLEKDHKALTCAIEEYDQRIQELLSYDFPAFIIESKNGYLSDFFPE